MEIHRFEAAWIVLGLLLIVGFIATVTYGAVGAGVTMISDEGGTLDPTAISNGNYGQVENFRAPGVYRTEDGYAAYVVARQFYFQPGSNQPLTVPADANVTFHVTSADVTHGFELVGTNVNVMVIPGQVSEITVRFDEPGRYGIVCNEYCGSGHHQMAGALRVVPAARFNTSG